MTGRGKEFRKKQNTVITVASRKKKLSEVVFRPFVEHLLITAKCGNIISKLLFLLYTVGFVIPR